MCRVAHAVQLKLFDGFNGNTRGKNGRRVFSTRSLSVPEHTVSGADYRTTDTGDDAGNLQPGVIRLGSARPEFAVRAVGCAHFSGCIVQFAHLACRANAGKGGNDQLCADSADYPGV